MTLNPLPGVPWVESPFFELFAETLDPKTEKIARDLHFNGYTVIDFPDPDFGEKIEGIKRDFAPHFRWDEWKSGKVLDLRIQDAWRFDERVRSIACNEEILNLLSRLYGKAAFPFQTLNFPVGTQQVSHSDHVHFNSIPERFMCGVWVAMEDVDEENGPLFYYPRSHKWPSYGNEHIGVSHQQMDKPYAEYQRFVDLWEALSRNEKIERQRFYAKKGQALIWSSNLVHGGSLHADKERSRWSQVTHYFFHGCGYTTPMENDVYNGKIYYRNILNAATGEVVKSEISGVEVPMDLIDRTRPAHMAPISGGSQPQSAPTIDKDQRRSKPGALIKIMYSMIKRASAGASAPTSGD